MNIDVRWCDGMSNYEKRMTTNWNAVKLCRESFSGKWLLENAINIFTKKGREKFFGVVGSVG